MDRIIAVVFHNDENRHQVGLVRDIRAGEVKPAAIVRCDPFDYQRDSFEGSDALFVFSNSILFTVTFVNISKLDLCFIG